MTAYQARKAKNDSDARRFPKEPKKEADRSRHLVYVEMKDS